MSPKINENKILKYISIIIINRSKILGSYNKKKKLCIKLIKSKVYFTWLHKCCSFELHLRILKTGVMMLCHYILQNYIFLNKLK